MTEETAKRPTLLPKLALSLASIAFCFAILGLGELYCRYFLAINLRKTSKDFIATDPAGRIIGNVKNARGVSFGTDVFSDANGFRIPQDYIGKTNDTAVLFLGDSVTFGVGVPEEKTFVGLLRRQLPDVTIYNSGVVGYALADYKRVADSFLPSHNEVKRVYLFYCLNDFQPPDDAKQTKVEDVTLFKSIKHAIGSIFVDLNEFLGPRSKLYVYITGLTADPSRRYFEWDLTLFNVNEDRLRETLAPIVEIDRLVKEHNARFVVFLNPYEMQIREGENANFEPQTRIENFLREKGISFIDTRDRFKSLPSSKDAFLFADPMHLNETGHRIVFGALLDDWDSKGTFTSPGVKEPYAYPAHQ